MIKFKRLKVLYWNANGIRQKSVELFHFMIARKIPIACINETKLKPGIRLSHPDFNIVRLDNPDGPTAHGGVMIIIHRSIQYKVINSFNLQLMEAVGVELTTNGLRQLRIFAAYLTGTARNHNYVSYRNDIISLTSLSNSLIAGDLNSKHHYWGCSRENRAGTVLFNEMMLRDFEIFAPSTPTYFPGDPRQPSTLDIMISTSSTTPVSIATTDDLGSDHLPVLAAFDVDIGYKPDYDMVRSFKNADWSLFRVTLDEMIDLKDFKPSGIQTTSDIDQLVASLTRSVQTAIDIAVPMIKVNSKGVTLSPQSQYLIQLRRAAKHRYMRSGRIDYKRELDRLKKTVEYW